MGKTMRSVRYFSYYILAKESTKVYVNISWMDPIWAMCAHIHITPLIPSSIRVHFHFPSHFSTVLGCLPFLTVHRAYRAALNFETLHK